MVAEAVSVDTAVKPEDTALLVEEASPALEQTETPETETTETVLGDATETVSWADRLAEVEESELIEHPTIKSLLARKEESLRQRIERDQQLKAGSDQQVQGTVTRLMQMLDAGEITSQQFQQTTAQVIAASHYYASVEIGRKLPDVLMANYKIPVEYRERALEAREQDKGNLDRYASILIDGAAVFTASNFDVDDVPKDSKLWKSIEKHNVKWREAESKAQSVSARSKLETPPSTTRGMTPGGKEVVPYHMMTPEQRAAMSPAERDRAVAALGR